MCTNQTSFISNQNCHVPSNTRSKYLFAKPGSKVYYNIWKGFKYNWTPQQKTQKDNKNVIKTDKNC